ncbi:hypothetical protein MLD38_027509 [Melastoma candidum]|uniref:Uncharacterized protein n=1 Tax=Melastoma candidum TaxID=119954 RepID=A0ACB9P7R9_9MYRT|nr:hypothetical protein MLD38_027509 [Melastoma candidum]
MLRLNFLIDLEMEQKVVKKSFPKLVYLEKVICPKLSFPLQSKFRSMVEEEALETVSSDPIQSLDPGLLLLPPQPDFDSQHRRIAVLGPYSGGKRRRSLLRQLKPTMSVRSFLLGTLQKAWEQWNLRMFILVSMTLQIILIFFAPFRKRSSNVLIIFSVWSAYLLADWAAAYCVGLISKTQIRKLSTGTLSDDQQDLLALWAPFLLLHLGGPDPITAFALEDNALWIRHSLSLILQAAAAAYVFFQTLNTGNHLIIPTILMFVAGIIKYLERTCSLYFASLKSFKNSMIPKPDAGPNYAKLMDEYSSRKEAHLPAKIEIIAEPKREVKSTYDSTAEDLTGSKAIKHAYHFFNIFKGLIVDLIFSFKERNESRQFFLVRTPNDAMKVISIELNFLYDVLFTKVRVIHSYWGYLFRTIATSSVVVTLYLFYHLRRKGVPDHDVIITFILLGAAISLEVIAFFMLILSDWTVARIKGDHANRVSKFLSGCIGKQFLSWKGLEKHKALASTECYIRYASDLSKRTAFKYEALDSWIFCRRWSESISAFNLVSYCLKQSPQKIIKKKGAWGKAFECFFRWLFYIPKLIFMVVKCLISEFSGLIGKALNFVSCGLTGYIAKQISRFARFISEKIGLKDILDDIWYVTTNPFIMDLWACIVKELQYKSQVAEDAETAGRISGSRGQWVLRSNNLEKKCEKLMKYIEEVEYDRSILLWHIATELCYNTDEKYEKENHSREFCKIISDYMLYLLVKQATMLSAIAGIGMIRYQDTCEEMKKFFRGRKKEMEEIVKPRKSGWVEVKKFLLSGHTEKNDEEMLREACKMILMVDTTVQPVDVKGDRSKSVMFDACILSKLLKDLKGEMWGIMIKVWVEMLSYGASHCRAETHAQLISKGGEFNTFVWLLMAHLGLGEQFQINEGHARAKLIVTK